MCGCEKMENIPDEWHRKGLLKVGMVRPVSSFKDMPSDPCRVIVKDRTFVFYGTENELGIPVYEEIL